MELGIRNMVRRWTTNTTTRPVRDTVFMLLFHTWLSCQAMTFYKVIFYSALFLFIVLKGRISGNLLGIWLGFQKKKICYKTYIITIIQRWFCGQLTWEQLSCKCQFKEFNNHRVHKHKDVEQFQCIEKPIQIWVLFPDFFKHLLKYSKMLWARVLLTG